MNIFMALFNNICNITQSLDHILPYQLQLHFIYILLSTDNDDAVDVDDAARETNCTLCIGHVK